MARRLAWWVLVLGLPCCGGTTAPPADASTDVHQSDAIGEVDGSDAGALGDVATDQEGPCVDAGMLVCNSTCTDPTTDPSNCGACGHDCVGGGCIASVCQPVVLATVTKGASSLWRIATDGTHVVFSVFDTFANGGGVFSVSVTGSNQTPLAVASSTTNQWARDVALVNGHVYWLQDDPAQNTAWKGSAATASSANHLSALDSSLGAGATWTTYGITVDSTEARLGLVDFFATADGGSSYTSVVTYPLATAGVIDVNNIGVGGMPGGNLVNDGTDVYFTLEQAGMVDFMPLAGSGISNLAALQSSPNLVAIDTAGKYLYWSTSAGIMRSSLVSPLAFTVASAAVAGLVVDSKYVYWTDASTSALMYKLGASTISPTTLVGSLSQPGALAKDGKALYWLDTGDGTVRKVALPL